MRRCRGAILLLACVAILSLGACGTSRSDANGPSTTFAPLSIPGSSTTTPPSNAATTVPAADLGSTPQAILDAASVSPSESCVDGSGSIRISRPIFDPPPDGLLTAIVDGQQVSERLSAPGSGLFVSGVRCDGSVHTVLLVVTGADGRSVTRAVAILMP
jgi:hypothetical protein